MRPYLSIALILAMTALNACSGGSPSTPKASATTTSTPPASAAPAGPDFVPTSASLSIDGAPATMALLGTASRPSATDYQAIVGKNSTTNKTVPLGSYALTMVMNTLKKDPSDVTFTVGDAGIVTIGLETVTTSYTVVSYSLDTKSGVNVTSHGALLDLDFTGNAHKVNGATPSADNTKVTLSIKGISTRK